MTIRIAGVVLAVWVMMATGLAGGATDYRKSLADWRAARATELTAEDGWLAVAGLFWLKPGSNRMGADAGADIVLPASVPALVGTVTLDGETIRAAAAADVPLRLNGAPFTESVLKVEGKPDTLTIGGLTMFVIKRGDRFAVRLKDRDSRLRREFTGLAWFPINEAWKIEARFVPYDTPRTMRFMTMVGTETEMPSPGYVEFQYRGKSYRLIPALSDEKLFFVFKDATSGETTYGAARFLYADLPKDGRVTLDFNKAVNPPCAYTPFATCPLPPPENKLKFAVTAGEKNYPGGHH